jgi:hypothetical protein
LTPSCRFQRMRIATLLSAFSWVIGTSITCSKEQHHETWQQLQSINDRQLNKLLYYTSHVFHYSTYRCSETLQAARPKLCYPIRTGQPGYVGGVRLCCSHLLVAGAHMASLQALTAECSVCTAAAATRDVARTQPMQR